MPERVMLITGSSGLVGSQAVEHFAARGWSVIGVDNDRRADFFGPGGSTAGNLKRLAGKVRFEHFGLDILDRAGIFELFASKRPGAVIHCAAQPSHDLARTRPFDDFEVNALGTLNLLEAGRRFSAEAPFVFMSTNKVYGDAPNMRPLVELEKRWEYLSPAHYDGIDESCGIDRSKHSLFGVSKAAADLMVQEYGRCFNMPTVSFRAGCVTGPNHAGVEMHGFLSYLCKVVVSGGVYTVYGYKGKQVRDQIHSHDVVRAFEEFISSPRAGAVYNLGGGRANSASVIECGEMIEAASGRRFRHVYDGKNRDGDHICYITDMKSFCNDYKNWAVTRPLEKIIEEMVEAESGRAGASSSHGFF